MRHSRPLTVLTACLLLAGCGKTDQSCPVKGTVSVNGQAAAGLYVQFLPVGGATKQGTDASARTGKDGSFSLRVSAPGEYAVTAFWPRSLVEEGDTVEGEDVFRGAFRDPGQPASRHTILKGENTLPAIELKFKLAKP